MRQPGDRAAAPPPLALAQDLANTVDIEEGLETLRSPDDLAAFAAAHGLPDLAFTDRDLAACLEFREALRAACQAHHGVDVPSRHSGVLERALARAPLVVSVDPRGGAGIVPAPGLRGTDALIAHVAAGIAISIADGTWTRLKACDAHSCRWVFYDRSPAGRGRWCTMRICGSRAKVRAYRARNSSR